MAKAPGASRKLNKIEVCWSKRRLLLWCVDCDVGDGLVNEPGLGTIWRCWDFFACDMLCISISPCRANPLVQRKSDNSGGLLFTLAVWMTPLAIYGLERATGVWPQGAPDNFQSYHIWVKGSWILMEVGTIIAALITLKFIRFPFLTFPIAFSLWYMSMDLTPLLFGKPEFTWQQRLWVSLFFGLLILLATYLIDRRTRDDYAFWGYLFGLMAFWGGLSLMESGSEWKKFLYCLLNVGLIILAVFLQRRVFAVFGGCGVFGYLGHLSYNVFKDSFLFPMALSILGLAVIYLGVQYQRHRERFEEAVLVVIPTSIRRLRPIER
jgi:hypothetical protein